MRSCFVLLNSDGIEKQTEDLVAVVSKDRQYS